MIHLAILCMLAVTPPKPTTWVTDEPGLLSPRTRGALEARLVSFRRENGPDVVLWIAKEMPKEPREVWCFRTFNAWGIGDKDRNDGVVLFVFAKGPKHCWITTGAGVMQAIPNSEAVRICREVVAPAVKAGRAEEGIVGAVYAILKKLDGPRP